MDGIVVHGVGGNRSQYRPITSQVTGSYLPVEVAGDLKRSFGFSELYIADLDSIQGRGNHARQVEAIRELGYSIYLDPGIMKAGDLASYGSGADRIVVGTETLRSLDELEEVCSMHPYVVVSLDFKGEMMLARDKSLGKMSPKVLVKRVQQAGASEIIYLDLKRVGTSSGTSSKRMETVITSSTIPVLVGGGIRNARDIEDTGDLGADGVLVATCIHTGDLKVVDVERLVG
jgi:phosphoribosylformimino-5-aminoimidazole carboxamide ribotide isomerase